MNTNTFQFFSTRAMALLFAILFTASAGLLGSNTVSAAPQMKRAEHGLEGTRVLSIRVNKSGRGQIVLSCGRCPNDRIQLKVTPDSHVTVNGQKIPWSKFRVGSGDFSGGFYKPESRELTRLIVTR